MAFHVGAETHFFIIIYLRALPNVWSSFKNSKLAADSVDPGNCNIRFPLASVIGSSDKTEDKQLESAVPRAPQETPQKALEEHLSQ